MAHSYHYNLTIPTCRLSSIETKLYQLSQQNHTSNFIVYNIGRDRLSHLSYSQSMFSLIIAIIIRMMEGTQPINFHHVIQALNTMQDPRANTQNVKIADDFLQGCQNHPHFLASLLQIYSEATNQQLQLSSLLLFINVIKRRWKAQTPGMMIPVQMKQQLRKNVLEAYMMHNLQHFKHFNEVIVFLTKHDFPTKYKELHQFVLNVVKQLTNLVKTNEEAILNTKKALAVLSTCKVIMKQYNNKKATHNVDLFLKYIVCIIQCGAILSQQILTKIKFHIQKENISQLIYLFEWLRKADKITLYGFINMPFDYQYRPEFQEVLNIFITRIKDFNIFYDKILSCPSFQLKEQVEKYLIGILQLIYKLQDYVPLLFVNCLKEYLYEILKILTTNIPNPHYYQNLKLLSVIFRANVKPLASYAYFKTPQQFEKSIYAKKCNVQHLQIQKQCHEAFKQIYSKQITTNLITIIICEIMTQPRVIQSNNLFCDQWILEDIRESSFQSATDENVFECCLYLLKNLIQCFKIETKQAILSMIEKIEELSKYTDQRSNSILCNIVEVILLIPHIYEQEQLPISEISKAIRVIYNTERFIYLSRLVRKYHIYIPTKMAKSCFQILAKLASSKINAVITPQIVYQSALALKYLISQMDKDEISLPVLSSCISNVVGLVNIEQVFTAPTILWPVINLLVKLVKSLYDISKQIVSEAAATIIKGLLQLISQERNSELLVNAIAQLISTLIFCCFKPIRQIYPYRGRQTKLLQKLLQLNKSNFMIFDAGIMFIKRNIRNKLIQSYDKIYRFWLTLIRSYPTLYQQQLYYFQLDLVNVNLVETFKNRSKDVMQADPIIFIQILEEYTITQLIKLQPNQLKQIIVNLISKVSQENRMKMLMAAASLYYSYSLLNEPIFQILSIFFKQMIALQNVVSPVNNNFRTFILLIIHQHTLKSSTSEMYRIFTNMNEGNFTSWFIPFLWSMTFVNHKFALKLNTAVIINAISEIGSIQYAQILQSSHKNQLAISVFLKVFASQLKPLYFEFVINSYHNTFRGILNNQLSPDFGESALYRKIHLHLSDPLLHKIAQADFLEDVRMHIGGMLTLMNVGMVQLSGLMGKSDAMKIGKILGWCE